VTPEPDNERALVLKKQLTSFLAFWYAAAAVFLVARAVLEAGAVELVGRVVEHHVVPRQASSSQLKQVILRSRYRNPLLT
jgi:hypothetical protein